MIKETTIKIDFPKYPLIALMRLCDNEPGEVDGYSLYTTYGEMDAMISSMEYEDGSPKEHLEKFHSQIGHIRTGLTEFKELLSDGDKLDSVHKDLGEGDYITFSKVLSPETCVGFLYSLSIGNTEDDNPPVLFTDIQNLGYVLTQVDTLYNVLGVTQEHITEFLGHMVDPVL